MSASLRALAASVRDGRTTARAVAEEHLERARGRADLGAFWHVDPELVLREADAVDRSGASGPLAGVPVAVKDAFAVRGWPTGAGAPPALAARDATAVRLLRRAGAVVLGTAAMHPLGWGMSGQAPGHPPCRNPLDPTRQPGGSSSGSAVAVGAGLAPLGLGADSGGSVRQPAAWCSVVGYKPAQAAVGRAGLAPLAPRLDTVGWLVVGVADAEIVAEALGAAPRPPGAGVDGVRVGVDEAVLERCDAAVAGAVQDALRALERQGARLRALALPGLPARLGPLYAAELAARWGVTVDAQPEAFADDVRAGVAAGRATSAVAYLAALHDREVARARTGLRDVDVVACPTCPILPPPLAAPDDVRTAGRLTRPFNLLDWPAISVPVAVPSVGLQIAAPRGREALVFTVARAVERG